MRTPFKFLLCVFICSVSLIGEPKDLIGSVKRRDIDEVKSLIEGGVSVNYKDSSGRTALHEAAAIGDVAIFKLLISAGADPDVKDNSGVTPEYIVLHTRDNVLRNEMIRSGPAARSPQPEDAPWTFPVAIARRQPGVVDMLLSLGVDANVNTKDGETPLYLAAQKGDPSIVELFLNHGANPNLQTRSGMLPIHCGTSGPLKSG